MAAIAKMVRVAGLVAMILFQISEMYPVLKAVDV
jgi:hypothetical protein